LSYDFGEALQGIRREQKGETIALAAYYPWGILVDKEAQQTLWIDDGSPLPDRIAEIKRRLISTLSEPSYARNDEPEARVAMGFQPLISKDDYARAFAQIQDYLLAGDCYQVNYAQPFVSEALVDPWQLYRALRSKNAGEYGCYWPTTELGTFLSFSPELFLRARAGRVLTSPIKGTAPRYANPAKDQASARELMNSPKNRAENIMIVDLLRNDLGRVCEVGSVVTTALCELKTLPSVHHLVSHVEGQLPPDSSPIDLLRVAFPGGSITGAPKRRAMEIIAELEAQPRGLYCGSMVALGNHGTMISSIAIRSMTINKGLTTVWGGGGIVSDSQADSEYEESLNKLSKILS
jgi:para-aminobenzoate synthetase component 1